MTEQDFLKRYTYNPTTDSLGHGGFGDVYRAYDNYLDRYVAIKVSQVRGDIEMLRLRNEVEKASKLLHPNVAHYEECHTMLYPTGEFDFAIMQYYEDGSLDKLFGSDSLTADARYDLLTQILEGIAYLHSEGIIHRDLKPQNVLIARRGDRYIPKITDFGISKQLDDGQSSAVSNSVLGGTRSYASPEQLKDSTIRKNTDLWSFGVIAFQMLVGKLPFDCGKYSVTSEEGRLELFRQMTSGVLPEALNDVPEPWQRLIRECLTVDNEKRIAHAEDCLAIIRGGDATAVEGNSTEVDPEPIAIPVEAVEVIPTPKPTPAPKVEQTPAPKPNPKPSVPATPAPKKRSKWWLWLLLLAIVGGGVFAYLNSQPKDNPELTPEPKTIVPDTIKEVDSVEVVVPLHNEAESLPEPEPEQTPTPDPVLRLTSNSRVTVEHGGGNGTIRYTLENPASGVNLSVSDDASWLTTSRSGNTISYSASANESQSSRRATITVSYGDQRFEVNVVQGGNPPEYSSPELDALQQQMTAGVLDIVQSETHVGAPIVFADSGENFDDADFAIEEREEEIVEEEIFTFVEEMATFRGGGLAEFSAWVQENVEYPQIALENGIQGNVVIRFVVDRDGKIGNYEVLQSPDRTLSEATIAGLEKANELSNGWRPGKQRGRPVRVYITLPVVFRIQD